MRMSNVVLKLLVSLHLLLNLQILLRYKWCKYKVCTQRDPLICIPLFKLMFVLYRTEKRTSLSRVFCLLLGLLFVGFLFVSRHSFKLLLRPKIVRPSIYTTGISYINFQTNIWPTKLAANSQIFLTHKRAFLRTQFDNTLHCRTALKHTHTHCCNNQLQNMLEIQKATSQERK